MIRDCQVQNLQSEFWVSDWKAISRQQTNCHVLHADLQLILLSTVPLALLQW